MDALALLCTLYADGPRTLKRLREVNGGTIDKLESLSAEVLAHALRADAPAAEQFRREARRLAAFDRTALDPEVEPGTDARQETEEKPPTEPARLENLTLTPMGSVTSVDEPVEETERLEAESEVCDATDSPEVAELVPEGDLFPRSIDGLDEESIERLLAAGIASLDELATFECVTVARESGLPYTHVRRLQFLARRRLEEKESTEPEAAIEVEETLAPIELVPAGKISLAGDPFHETVAPLQGEVETHRGSGALGSPASGPFAEPS